MERGVFCLIGIQGHLEKLKLGCILVVTKPDACTHTQTDRQTDSLSQYPVSPTINMTDASSIFASSLTFPGTVMRRYTISGFTSFRLYELLPLANRSLFSAAVVARTVSNGVPFLSGLRRSSSIGAFSLSLKLCFEVRYSRCS